MTVCPECHGDTIDGNGDLCGRCHGLGTLEPQGESVAARAARERRLQGPPGVPRDDEAGE